jgi:hypothetical protein
VTHICRAAALLPTALLLATVTTGSARADGGFTTEPGTMGARLRAVLVDPTISSAPMFKPGRFRAPDKLLAMLSSVSRSANYAE